MRRVRRKPPKPQRVQIARPDTGEIRTFTRHGPIPPETVSKVEAAWRYACDRGWTPTMLVSINWRLAPPRVDGLQPVDRIGLLRDGLKSAFFRSRDRHGLKSSEAPWVWIEAREKPPGAGEGLHLAIFVPDACWNDMCDAIERLVEHQSADVSERAIDVREITEWWFVRDYLLKAASQEARETRARVRAIRRHKGSQGVIDGPRVRVSHSLGSTARKAWEARQLEGFSLGHDHVIAA